MRLLSVLRCVIMMHSRTNLLPPDRARSLRRLYFLRLSVASVLVLASVAVMHGIFLLPTYLHVQGTVLERSAALAALAHASSEGEGVSARVAALTDESVHLARLRESPKASATIKGVAAMPRPGISLYGFSFSAGTEGPVMTVAGNAQTREALRMYVDSLASAPYIDSAELPISAYAKERDIEFTVSLSGPFLP